MITVCQARSEEHDIVSYKDTQGVSIMKVYFLNSNNLLKRHEHNPFLHVLLLSLANSGSGRFQSNNIWEKKA